MSLHNIYFKICMMLSYCGSVIPNVFANFRSRDKNVLIEFYTKCVVKSLSLCR